MNIKRYINNKGPNQIYEQVPYKTYILKKKKVPIQNLKKKEQQ